MENCRVHVSSISAWVRVVEKKGARRGGEKKKKGRKRGGREGKKPGAEKPTKRSRWTEIDRKVKESERGGGTTTNGRDGERERIYAAGRRGASVVRYEKMVIPSRMCPMHMHIFPQNGWSEGGGVEGGRGWKRRGRTKRV